MRRHANDSAVVCKQPKPACFRLSGQREENFSTLMSFRSLEIFLLLHLNLIGRKLIKTILFLKLFALRDLDVERFFGRQNDLVAHEFEFFSREFLISEFEIEF